MNNNLVDNTQSSNNDNFYIMKKIILLLIGLQIGRIILKESTFLFLSYNKFNDIIISMITVSFLILFIIYKSKKENISLDVFSYMKNKESKMYYFILTGAIMLLIFTSPSFSVEPSTENLLILIYTTIMIPVYEEILFRSYIWNVLKEGNKEELKIYILTTILFSLYHIGYIDTVIMTNGFNNIVLIIFIKCCLMLSYGLFIGFFRYKIKNSYSCILIHSFINIFGR